MAVASPFSQPTCCVAMASVLATRAATLGSCDVHVCGSELEDDDDDDDELDVTAVGKRVGSLAGSIPGPRNW